MARVRFFDGFSADCDTDGEVVDIELAVGFMDLQGNWKRKKIYYPCSFLGYARGGAKLLVRYYDGVEEKVELSQLRASIPS